MPALEPPDVPLPEEDALVPDWPVELPDPDFFVPDVFLAPPLLAEAARLVVDFVVLPDLPVVLDLAVERPLVADFFVLLARFVRVELLDRDVLAVLPPPVPPPLFPADFEPLAFDCFEVLPELRPDVPRRLAVVEVDDAERGEAASALRAVVSAVSAATSLARSRASRVAARVSASTSPARRSASSRALPAAVRAAASACSPASVIAASLPSRFCRISTLIWRRV